MKRIPDESLLDEIRRLADGESPPTESEFREKAEYSRETVRNKWGSWNAGLREAGFNPNHEISISDEKLLKTLRKDAQGKVAPSMEDTTCGTSTYQSRFETWWRASVRAGLQPHDRRPLTHPQSESFFEATTNQQKPDYQLLGLLSQFTGLPPTMAPKLSPEWITTQPEDVVITIPASETSSGERWTFKLPNAWNDADGNRQETGLPELLTWFIEQGRKIGFSESGMIKATHRIAQNAKLPDRETVHISRVGATPLVRRGDLRATGGIQMARNGAPSRRIRRHLGIEHTNWKADVEDFFLWLYVHEGYEHPEYDPPDMVLNSVL
jgi:hypothetical protein